MLIPLAQLVRDRLIQPGAVLHVGAHLAEEAPVYANLGFTPVWWVEGNPRLVPVLRSTLLPYPNQYAVGAVCVAAPGEVKFHVANNGQSSSILPLGTHAREHPEVVYIDEFTLQATTVDTLQADERIGQASLVNIDVQGAELEVLKGAERYLEGVRALYLEVNEELLYEGCALLPELERWLDERGFSLVVKAMTPHGWGDGVFIRR